MSFAAFVSGVMQPTIQRARAEDAMKRRLEEAGAEAKLTKALNEWEFYSPDERNVVSADLDKILKQKKGYSADLLGKGEQGYKFLQGALGQQKPIQELEQSASGVAALPINLPQRIPGPESLDAVEPGQFEKGPDINVERPPVNLPRLPIEGANIPRVNENILSLPASQRAQAVRQYAADQAGIQTRSTKIAEIDASDMDPIAKQLAKEAILGVPPGVLAVQQRHYGPGAAGQNVGLSGIELINPADPNQKMIVQMTRDGRYVRSGTQEFVDPEIARTWNKRVVSQPHWVVQQDNTPALIDTERLLSQTRGHNATVGEVTGVKARENLIPEVNPGGYISGLRGASSGNVTPVAPGNDRRTSPLPYTEAKEIATFDKDEEFIRNFGELYNENFIGPIQGRWNDLMAKSPQFMREMVGYKGSPELADFRTASAHLLNAVVKFTTGAQMGVAEAERIRKEVPTPDLNPEDWKAAYRQTLRNVQMMKQRMMEMGVWNLPERTQPNPPVANREQTPTLSPEAQRRRQGQAAPAPQAPSGDTVRVRRKADGKTGKMSRAAYEANKAKYDLVQ